MKLKTVRQRGPNNTSPTSDILRKSRPEKMMSDIVLFGKSSQGKSSSLQHLVVLLLSGGNTPNPNIIGAFETRFWNGKTYDDFMIIVKYHRYSDGKESVIYISTKGDTWEIVENNFEFFYRQSKRQGKTIHIFDGLSFVKWEDLSITEQNLWLQESPSICISPANFRNGSIQAQRYYLDATYNDWKCEHWIRREREEKPTDPLLEYSHKIICKTHDITARNLIGLIHSVMDNDYKK